MIKKKLVKEKYEGVSSPYEDFKLNPETEMSEVAEKKEKLTNEEFKKIRKEIEKTDLAESLIPQIQKHAQDVKVLGDNQKIKKLLEIADEKGIIYAVNVAKKMDNPYVLDVFHDILIKNGYYDEFK